MPSDHYSQITPSESYGFTETVWKHRAVGADSYALRAKNIFGGPAVVQGIEATNFSTSVMVYLKVYDLFRVVNDNTGPGRVSFFAPMLVFPIPPGTQVSYRFPDGISFSEAVTVRCVQGADQDNDSGPSHNVAVTIVAAPPAETT